MPNLKFVNDADLDALAARVAALESGKADKAMVDALNAALAGKADKTALDALAVRVTALEGAPAPEPAPTPSPTPDPTPIPPPPPAQYGASLNEDEPPLVSGNVARYAGSEYSSLLAAINAAPAGAAVDILPGGHDGLNAITQYFNKPITLRGMRDSQGRAPLLRGPAVQKALINTGADIVLEDLILKGATTGLAAGNAAGWRPEPSCLSAILRRVIFTDCQNGILTPTDLDFSEILLAEDCVFKRNGVDGYAHNLYLGYGKEVKFVRCTFKDHKGGHLFKSRAWRTLFDSCLLEDRFANRSLEVPIGGFFHFANGKIIKYETANGNMTMIAFNNESQGEGQGRADSALVENSILDGRLANHVIFENGQYSGTTAIIRNCQMPNSRTVSARVSIQ